MLFIFLLLGCLIPLNVALLTIKDNLPVKTIIQNIIQTSPPQSTTQRKYCRKQNDVVSIPSVSRKQLNEQQKNMKKQQQQRRKLQQNLKKLENERLKSQADRIKKQQQRNQKQKQRNQKQQQRIKKQQDKIRQKIQVIDQKSKQMNKINNQLLNTEIDTSQGAKNIKPQIVVQQPIKSNLQQPINIIVKQQTIPRTNYWRKEQPIEQNNANQIKSQSLYPLTISKQIQSCQQKNPVQSKTSSSLPVSQQSIFAKSIQNSLKTHINENQIEQKIKPT